MVCAPSQKYTKMMQNPYSFWRPLVIFGDILHDFYALTFMRLQNLSQNFVAFYAKMRAQMLQIC
ncbi:hypothetical protein BKN38_06025 [Helicobacter sp. CLO-3]|nr:hypothetical protein BA723_08740 [Helicobacter sp. CLO-3]OHU83092.1 hypothetical protein BKN38_06025 [Helicobacter sp. CLO-3]